MKQNNLFEASTYSIIGGMCLTALYPPFAIAGWCLFGGGCYGAYKCIVGATKFNRLFINLKLGVNEEYPIFKKKKHTDYSTIYIFTLPAGLSSEDFEKNKLAISENLGRDINIQYTYKEIQIEVFESEFKHSYEYYPIEIKGDVPILIGYDRKGETVTCDLSIGEPHMLIAGETGSGKSTTLRSLITNLILKSNVKLHLVDLKMGAEFNVFRKSSKVETFSRTIKECQTVLEDLSIEVDRRYNLFYDKDVKDIKEYNHKYSKLDYQILIIDEFADLQDNKKCKDILQELGRKARACRNPFNFKYTKT